MQLFSAVSEYGWSIVILVRKIIIFPLDLANVSTHLYIAIDA